MTCSRVSTSGICSSIGRSESDVRGDHHRTPGTGNEVPAADTIDVALVGEIQPVDAQGQLIADAIAGHGVDDPVGRRGSLAGVVIEAIADVLRPAADFYATRQSIRAPQAE